MPVRTSEDDCTFVSSRGLLKSCHFRSPNPRSSCGWDADYLRELVANPSKQFRGMRIYVCSELLKFFVHNILPHIHQDFALLTGDSDLSMPVESLTPEDTALLLQNSHLRRWGAQNLLKISSPKQLQIPIGLDYHTIAADPKFAWRSEGEGHLPVEQEAILKSFRSEAATWKNRKLTIYTNAQHRFDRFNDRKAAIETISGDILHLEPYLIPRTDVWRKYTEYAFVLSPFGNGLDCHRTWEALCCGAIPIIRNPFLSDLFADLPVLNVRAWSDVTPELLQKTIAEFSEKTFNYEKLTLKFWVDALYEKSNSL